MERRMVKMTLKLMTQQVLENFLVALQCLDPIELSSSIVKSGASVALLLIYELVTMSVLCIRIEEE